jgi:hypothetical protein
MKWQKVDGFLAVQREQVSETHGKDWINNGSRLQGALSIKTLWEADVLPLHHSREKLKPSTFPSVFGCFWHCN